VYLGEPSVKLLHTPGHAKDLVGVVLPGRILTADALLIGTCGRTNLLNGNATRQYHTLYHTYKSLPEGLEVYPGHDYQGRICSTLGDEKKSNPKMLCKDEEEFVRYMDLKKPKKLDPVEHLAEALRANIK
jgi:sulfur dioxygenase